MGPVKRGYHAPLREQQAAQTRQRIAEAAVEEFSEHGWAGTTVAAIAARAGVTPQAVYQAVGGKPALLVRAVETAVAGSADDVMLADRPSFAAAYEPGLNKTQRLRAFAAATAEAYHRAAALFLVLQDAARSDPTAKELAAAGADRRLTENRRLANLLRPGSDARSAAELTDAIWVLTGPAVYADLVHHRKWTAEQYRTFLEDMLDAAIRRTGSR
ncbi:TetR/AcrR family transcriptional regulator [Amycolatopsis australiensis]|uniref:DNA-binding transcriptional regulator, AcrR family n=1 Tax=Amycolatopsis australiensis TaxID=546364 RepID=A0A1K1SBE5_9PSEU|nr:TetR/AcrR family transcriptional regulator [Amycolatopsis australiensis]SFW81357.1 DNA-binding transcriptional regulator, AcrR family [Amycolatopsis australiensis]